VKEQTTKPTRKTPAKAKPRTKSTKPAKPTKSQFRTRKPKTYAEPEITMDLAELKLKKINELTDLAVELDVEGVSGLRKQELIFAIIKTQAGNHKRKIAVMAQGVLEILPDGFGFLRAPDYNYMPGPDDFFEFKLS